MSLYTLKSVASKVALECLNAELLELKNNSVIFNKVEFELLNDQQHQELKNERNLIVLCEENERESLRAMYPNAEVISHSRDKKGWYNKVKNMSKST